MAGIAKSATTPTHMTTLLVRSHRPDQASTVGLIERFTQGHLYVIDICDLS